ncbi:hypothetical protein C7E20_08095 [Sphingobium sp. AEW4]|nr:hypothetical protein C7E20_08095 [Sphingobium sp. AEW4]TWD19068.1 hypothetical protein FB594_1611 [Sphingobium sp. AEW001]
MKTFPQRTQSFNRDMRHASPHIDQEQAYCLFRSVKIGIKIKAINSRLIAEFEPYLLRLTSNNTLDCSHSNHSPYRAGGINPKLRTHGESGDSATQFNCFCPFKNGIGMAGMD